MNVKPASYLLSGVTAIQILPALGALRFLQEFALYVLSSFIIILAGRLIWCKTFSYSQNQKPYAIAIYWAFLKTAMEWAAKICWQEIET